ncbi:MAG: iron-sulfur cluster assembly accessory protein [archaeon]|nr:iron-sulfur cluster assembly accessory protein [archaeon]
MVTITPEASKFIKDFLEKNGKTGYGIRMYMTGLSCSGPQFGMALQEKASNGENTISVGGLNFFCDDETKEALDPCIIEFINDVNFGTGITIRDPNIKGCESCGGGCH